VWNCYLIENSCAWLIWSIINAETYCTLYNMYFLITVLTDLFSIPSSILQIATRYLSHRTLRVWFLMFWVSRFKHLYELAVFSYILRGSFQSLRTHSAIANKISSRPNHSDPFHSRFINHSFVVEWLACWPLVYKFVGSNPAEAVGFFGQKIPQHTFYRTGNKVVHLRHVKYLYTYCGSRMLYAKLDRSFLAPNSFLHW
jgi:hypothetical protein